MKNNRLRRQYERSIPFRRAKEASDAFWKRWHEESRIESNAFLAPRRQEFLQELATLIARKVQNG